MDIKIANKKTKELEAKLKDLVEKQAAFLTQQTQAQVELDRVIDQIGSAALETGEIAPGEIVQKQAELKAVESALSKANKLIPETEAELKKEFSDYAFNRIDKIASTNKKILFNTAKAFLAELSKWDQVVKGYEEAEELTGRYPGPNRNRSEIAQRNYCVDIMNLAITWLDRARALNPEIEPLIKDFEALGIGQRI